MKNSYQLKCVLINGAKHFRSRLCRIVQRFFKSLEINKPCLDEFLFPASLLIRHELVVLSHNKKNFLHFKVNWRSQFFFVHSHHFWITKRQLHNHHTTKNYLSRVILYLFDCLLLVIFSSYWIQVFSRVKFKEQES